MVPNACYSFKKPLLGGLFILTTVLVSCEKYTEPTPLADPANTVTQSYGQPGVDYVANEVLVKFKAGTSDKAKAMAVASINGRVAESILTNVMKRAGETEDLLRVSTPMAATEAIARLKNSSIEYAEPNVIYSPQGVKATYPIYRAYDSYYVKTDGDTYINSGEWGMYGATSLDFMLPNKNPFGSGADVAWAKGNIGSSSVAVGIVDTGIQTSHPDLDGQVNNPVAIINPSLAYPKDIYGWNFIDNNNDVSDYGSKPYSRDHGTYMAGIIGAKPDLSPTTTATSVVGMNWNITLVAAKFMDAKGGTTANAVNAINYLIELKKRGVNIVAINCSWGSYINSTALFEIISSASANNILVIASAGNGDNAGSPVNDDVTPFYPACFALDNIISVAAINPKGSMYQSSNYGLTSVDLGAPGARIWTTVAGSSWYSYSGTSVATAFVTGAAALYSSTYASTHSGVYPSAATIKAAILDAAVVTPTASLYGKCVTGGRLNVSGF